MPVIAENPCAGCGNQFRTHRNRKAVAKYCTWDCFISALARGKKERYRKSGTPAFVHRIVRKVGACQTCGATDDLQGHHRLPVSTRPDLELVESNIEVLCRPCHAAEHPAHSHWILARKDDGHYIDCKECGKNFRIWRSDVGRKKYCSKDCYNAAIRKYWPHRHLQVGPMKPRMLMKCLVCGIEFDRPPSAAVDAKVCSGKCRGQYLSKLMTHPRQSKSCAHCGVVYTPKNQAEFEKSRHCSKRCNGLAWQVRQMVAKQHGANHPDLSESK